MKSKKQKPKNIVTKVTIVPSITKLCNLFNQRRLDVRKGVLFGISGSLNNLKQLDYKMWSKPDPSDLPLIQFVPDKTTKHWVVSKIVYNKQGTKESTYNILLYDERGSREELFLCWNSIESYIS